MLEPKLHEELLAPPGPESRWPLLVSPEGSSGSAQLSSFVFVFLFT